jgi:hypothetical protein
VLAAAAAALLASSAAGAQFALARPLDASRPIPYFIAEPNRQVGGRPQDRDLAVWALEAWQRAADGALRFVPAAEADALIRLYWVAPDDGQYGETRTIVVGSRFGAAAFVRPDTDALEGPIARRAREDPLLRDTIVYLTSLHELGHAFGLSHTSGFRDVMYFF